MKQVEITAEIIQLTRLGLVNCYLVREDDGVTLIDTMISGSAGVILDAAQALNRRLRRIALTHVHGDHVGSLDGLANALAGIEVAVGRRESRLLQRDFQTEPDEPHRKIRGSFPRVKTIPSVLLNDGEMYGSLRVVASPGHTPGHIAFFDVRSGTLIAGDALVTVGGLRVSGDASAAFPIINWATWHKPTAVASARRLLELQPKTIAVGHGKPITQNASAALQRAIRHAE
ncbi:MAG: MBL fold metallo-hydrolase [Silvibacterium sp.]|nr:MBL fold metallo-hydrolase [Silvibacterium sp.]MBV8436589.1 MBL fold metallo-hydrolase [Silvibacterium sp.]